MIGPWKLPGAPRSFRGPAVCTNFKKHGETNKKGEENILNKRKKHKKTKVVCNPDSGLLVALGVPRIAFLAYFQPAGASRRPDRGDAKIHKNTGIKTNGFWAYACIYIYIYIYIYIHMLMDFWGFLEKVVSKALST
jgi:hypothetical protein